LLTNIGPICLVSSTFVEVVGRALHAGHELRGPMQDKIPVSIAMQRAHSVSMHGDAIDKAMTYSFWALGFLLSAGIVLAVLVW
jgi:hypothetical protein